MIHFYCIALLVLCGQVELSKLGLLSSQQPDQAEYFPMRQQQPYGYQHQFYAGRPQPLAYQPYQPPALAYVIVRPIAPTYPYYDNSVRYWSALHQAPAAPLLDSGIKGGERQLSALEQAAPTKGGSRPEFIKQEKLEQERLEQEPQLQQQQQLESVNQAPPQQDQLYDMGLGKLLKIKSSFDKFAAGAKSKLTLGSRYYVTGEEFVAPAAPPQPLRQEQLQTSDLQLTKLEQQRVEEAGQTKLETQQLEDIRQTKIEDTRQTKIEDTRQTKLEESAGTKLEDSRKTKLEEAPLVSQTKLEDTRQEKLTQQQEPLRETKGLEQPLQQPQQLQQERYTEKGLQQQQQYQYQQQQKEEYQQGALKNQVRFNGQQPPTAYLSGQIDADGFGKRHSAI